MKRKGLLALEKPSAGNQPRVTGGNRRHGDHARRRLAAPSPQLLVLMTASILAACQSTDDAPRYPDLGTVSSPSTTGYPLEERRQIVRELIEDRDLARHRQATVRHRSGLSDTPPPAAPIVTGARAEDIIQGAPLDDPDETEDLPLDEAERAYRDRTQFDDGTLDDFIRTLKRDTAPPAVDDPAANEDGAAAPSEAPGPQSWSFEGEPPAAHATLSGEPDWPIVLAAFAPTAAQESDVVAIRLAASDDRGFWCTYLGWAVAWSDACLVEGEGTGSDGEEVAGVDTGEAGNEQAVGQSEDLPTSGGGAAGDGEQTAGQDPSGAGEGRAQSEDLEGDGLLPMSSTLDRLRNLIRSRNRSSETRSIDQTSLSYEAEELRPRALDGPPLPVSRPEVEQDLRIVRNDYVFEFDRTPRPAFKPLPPEPKTVIFPPETPRQKKTDFVPAARPSVPDDQAVAGNGRTGVEPDVPDDKRGEDVAAIDPVARDLEDAKRGPFDPAEPDGSLLLDSELILFDPGSAKLPAGIEARLRVMLDEAKEKHGKLFIVSEASVGNLAMERARGVGLALVRMGATADLIEYDIVVDRGADHVQLLLKEAGKLDEADAGEPDGTE